MQKEIPNEDRLHELLLPFIDKGFLDFFPDAKTELLHNFIQSMAEFYHLRRNDPTDQPSARRFVDLFQVLDLLMRKENEPYIPDFFLAISLVSRAAEPETSAVVSPEQRLSAALIILQLDQIVDEIMQSEEWIPNKQVGKSLFVMRNNLVVSLGLPSLAKQADIRKLATQMPVTIKPVTEAKTTENAKPTAEAELQAYLAQNKSIHFGEAQLHIQASDQIRIAHRINMYAE